MTPANGDAIMATTKMEEPSPPIEQPVEPTTVDSFEPRPAPRVVSSSRTLVYGIPRERRLWTAALAAALLVASGGLALLYVDDTNNQSANQKLTTQNESLTGRNQLLMDELKLTQTNLTATLGELAKVQAELDHPHLVIWNVAQPINGPTWYLAGGIPDTFTYHLQATSTGPMSVSILTFEQFAKAIECVDNGVANTNYCMHHSISVITWAATA